MAAIVFNPYCIPVLVTAFLCALLALFVRKRKNARAAGHLLALLIFVVIWCASYTFELCFVNEKQKLIAIMVQYISIPSLPVLFALFVYRYTNPSKKIKSPLLTILLFVIPAAVSLLMATNIWHFIMYSGWTITSIPGTAYTFLVPQYGLGFIISTAYSYIVTCVSFSYIIYVSVKTTKFFSAQAIVLFCCAIVPITANIMYFLKSTPYIYLDFTPVAFLFSAALMTYLVTGMKLLDLQPLARDMIIENTTDGTILLDNCNIVLDLNPMAEKIFSVQKSRALGKNINEFFDRLPENGLHKKNENIEFERNDKVYLLSALPLYNHSDDYMGQILAIRDITEAKRAENKVKRLAFFDTLTGLPNHTHMIQELEKLLHDAESHGFQVITMLFDINNLNHINSFYGYEFGDALIKKVVDLITPHVKNKDIFARMKGGEFIIARPVYAAPENSAISLAGLITRLFLHPVIVKDKYISAGVNIGICISSNNENDPNSLVQKAGLALGQAIGTKEHYALYSAQKENEIAERNKLMNALRTALCNNEFSLEYQPQYNHDTHSLYGVEALLRWTHPVFGKVPPSQFIGLLEDSGIIIPVGNWVVAESANQFKKWITDGIDIPKFSINLSVRQFDNDDLIPFILNTLDSRKIPRNRLEVEVTETLAALADSNVVKKICALSKSGIRVAIDDFGAGFSSLTYFKYLNVNTLKIDREISIDIHKNRYSTAIFESLKLVCDALGVDIITEYVETDEQIEKLLSLGCKNFQGYYYAKPLSPAAFEQYAASLKS
ncbi:MAG: EAL domain-containing protein [Eubacteriales bacterium]|nr:EAL domain-containing protein [Eubacteriales bacterium]